MTLGEFLRRIGNTSVYESIESGEEFVTEIAKITGVDLDVTAATGSDCLRALAKLSASQRSVYLNREIAATDSNLDMKMISDLVYHLRAGQSGWKTLVAVMMAVAVFVLVLTYALLMYKATMLSLPLPRWQDITCVIVVPGGIVWAWYGVLTKENRDLISAALGELPKKGPFGAILDAFTRKAPVSNPAPVTPTQVPDVPPVYQTPPPSDTGGSSVPNDNPPPGAAGGDFGSDTTDGSTSTVKK